MFALTLDSSSQIQDYTFNILEIGGHQDFIMLRFIPFLQAHYFIPFKTKTLFNFKHLLIMMRIVRHEP